MDIASFLFTGCQLRAIVKLFRKVPSVYIFCSNCSFNFSICPNVSFFLDEMAKAKLSTYSTVEQLEVVQSQPYFYCSILPLGEKVIIP